MRKGSPAAKAWGAKMKRARNAKNGRKKTKRKSTTRKRKCPKCSCKRQVTKRGRKVGRRIKKSISSAWLF